MSSYMRAVNNTGVVMVGVLVYSVVHRGFEPRLGQSKHHKTDICSKHTLLRRESKD